MHCNYCKKEAQLVTGEIMYPHRPDLYKKQFYLCKPCDAYVGCHKNTCNPLGRLANRELRLEKTRTHNLFDPLWKKGGLKRKEAYQWLSGELDLPIDETHIGLFDVKLCKQAQTIIKNHDYYKAEKNA